jgi:hypothetical protein
MINGVMSPVATISLDGTLLTIISVGSFRILATVTASSSPNFDYGGASVASELITVLPATPTLTTLTTYLSLIPSLWEYNGIYPIPYPQTSNTDLSSNLIVTYSTDFPNIISISGINITIKGLGNFNIKVSIASTTNFNAAPNILITYYTASQATPSISPFSYNYGSTWVEGTQYALTNIVTPNTLTSYIIYTIINQNPSGIASIYPDSSGTSVNVTGIGTFQIQADLAETTYYTSATSVQTNPITISPLTPEIIYYNFIDLSFQYNGGPYTLSITTTNTDPGLQISYTINPNGGNGGNGYINGDQLYVTAAGYAYITVSFSATANYIQYTFNPVSIYISQAPLNYTLNTSWFNEVQFQIGYSFYAGVLLSSYYNTDSPGPTITYSNSYPNIGTMSGTTLTCIAPGSMYYNITISPTANFTGAYITSPTFYVSVVPEIIIFNNPRAWPLVYLPFGGILTGEPGMIIGLPWNTYPYGFGDYSQVTITNSNSPGSSITITDPLYSSICNSSYEQGQYAVFFDLTYPMIAGICANRAWDTSTATNIGYVSYDPLQNIAAGIQTGANLNFVFSGQKWGSGPSSLSVNWNPGSINVQPGQIYGSYYSISPGSPFPNPYPPIQGMTVNNGSYTVGWSGFGVQDNTQYFTSSYGIYWMGIRWGTNTIYTANPNYFAFSVSGSTPNQAWGVSGASNQPLSDGNGNAYFQGIPKILYPYYNN